LQATDTPRLNDCDGLLRTRRRFDRFVAWDGSLPADLVDRMWDDPHALLADGAKLQDKLRSTITRIEHPAGRFTWKYHNWGTLLRTAKKSLSDSPAKKSWRDSQFLLAAGVPTPQVRAYVERRIGPFNRSSYLLTDYVAGTSLYRLMRFEQPSADFIAHLADQVAVIWQRLDDAGIWHNDFKTENLLVDPQGKIWLIDLERMRRFRDRGKLRRRQKKDVGDLLHPRNWRSNPAAAEAFRRAIAATPAGRDALAGPTGATHPLEEPCPTINCPSHLVTVLICCRNAADTILACLESVRDMADEILVADNGSTDETLEVVREFGDCRIIQRDEPDEVAFATWAQAHARHDWILRLQPDEQLNAELSRQVQDLLAAEPAQDGFQISRTVYFHGRRLLHSRFHNEPSIRLSRKRAGRFELRDGRVEMCIASGHVGSMKSRIVYEACRSTKRCLRELAHDAIRAAESAHAAGRRSRLRSMLWRAPWMFVRSYVIESGWLDGSAGLRACVLTALAVYLREAILRELEQPAVEKRPLVHDSWRPLRVYAPGECTPHDDVSDTLPIRSAA
jgi:hypothetical protein